MAFLQIYILGVGIVCLIEGLLFKNKSFYNYFKQQVDQASLSIDENYEPNYNALINFEIIITSLFSWLGLIVLLFPLIIGWLLTKKE